MTPNPPPVFPPPPRTPPRTPPRPPLHSTSAGNGEKEQ